LAGVAGGFAAGFGLFWEVTEGLPWTAGFSDGVEGLAVDCGFFWGVVGGLSPD
jgi:hypothetical protein